MLASLGCWVPCSIFDTFDLFHPQRSAISTPLIPASSRRRFSLAPKPLLAAWVGFCSDTFGYGAYVPLGRPIDHACSNVSTQSLTTSGSVDNCIPTD